MGDQFVRSQVFVKFLRSRTSRPLILCLIADRDQPDSDLGGGGFGFGQRLAEDEA